ncbi:4-aminobutyrate aminotransferase-like enzyme [Agrococcus sp. UYP10]|uniref:aspartate aminotransferase family protein n=1 Tax=Agrococcus sp. UYP10 TaxID=1756355 RepID=UPI0033993158
MVSLGASLYPSRFDPARLEEVDPVIRDNIERRLDVLGPGYLLVYNDPVAFVRGSGAHLFDAEGRDYLDAYNNVPVVGHCHPHVVEAVSRQLATLNTNTRYAQAGLVDYAERLVALFPEELRRVTFACSGSEANDLALRVARHHTGHEGMIVTRWAYHGITREVASISPSLGAGSPLGPNVREIDAPDPRLVPEGLTLAEHMLAETQRAIRDLERHGFGMAALVLDLSFMSDGVLPEAGDYLQPMVDAVQDAGGVFIADEVQAGFGRLGTCMWGFASQGVVPDIVTMGKPMGNGIPLSAVVFRPEVARDFGETVRYFNTFGGSSVPIAAGAAVLDVFEREGVPERAERVGALLRDGIARLLEGSPHIADVRGAGLLVGVEIVADLETRAPDRARATRVIDGMRERRILISAAGRDANVLKIRPPLAFDEADVERFLEGLGEVAALHLR